VLNLERKWLASMPWEAVVKMNQDLCLKDKQPHEPNAAGYEAARRIWSDAAGQNLRLRDVLDLFRQVHKLAPFRFFNGNMVAALARNLMSEMVDRLPPVHAQMARSTVSHYVVGAIKVGELESVLGHVEELRRSLPPAPANAPPGALAPAPVAP
jgi:hypothetical protein